VDSEFGAMIDALALDPSTSKTLRRLLHEAASEAVPRARRVSRKVFRWNWRDRALAYEARAVEDTLAGAFRKLQRRPVADPGVWRGLELIHLASMQSMGRNYLFGGTAKNVLRMIQEERQRAETAAQVFHPFTQDDA
jgi:hypothetical protein